MQGLFFLLPLLALAQLPCKFNAGKTHFDMSRLSGRIFETTDAIYNYKLSVCGASSIPRCSASACQFLHNAQVPLARLKSLDGGGDWSLLDPAHPELGVKAVTKTGDHCGMNVRSPRITTWKFTCNPKVAYGPLTAQDHGPSCAGEGYIFHMETKYACPAGIGSGWVFVLVVVFGFLLYVLLGFAWNHKMNGLPLAESFPHPEFWRGLPSLVRDGCVFSFDKIQTCIALVQARRLERQGYQRAEQHEEQGLLDDEEEEDVDENVLIDHDDDFEDELEN